MSLTFPTTIITCDLNSGSYHNTTLLVGETKYRGSKFTFNEKKHVTKFKSCLTTNSSAVINYRYLILDENRRIIHYSSIYSNINLSNSCSSCTIENNADLVLEIGTYYICIAFSGNGTAGINYQFVSSGATAGVSGGTTAYDLTSIITNTTLQLTSTESYYSVWVEAETYTPPVVTPPVYVCDTAPNDTLNLGDLATVASISLTSGITQIRGNKIDLTATTTKISKVRYYIGADTPFNIDVRAILYTQNLVPVVASPIYNITLNYSTYVPEAWKEITVNWDVPAGTYCIAIAMAGVGTAKMRYRTIGAGSGVSIGVAQTLQALETYTLTTGISTNWYSVNSISCDAIEYVEPPPIEPPPIEPPVEPPITPPTATGNMLLLAFVFVFIIILLIVLLIGGT